MAARTFKNVGESEEREASRQIEQCLCLRRKYAPGRGSAAIADRGFAPAESTALSVSIVKGVVEVAGFDLPAVPTWDEFSDDLIELWGTAKNPVVKSFSMARLSRLRNNYKAYLLDNGAQESHDVTTLRPDLYSVMKVDNHVHLAAAMTARQLLEFMRSKLRSEPHRELARGRSLLQLMSESLSCEKLDADEVESKLGLDALKTSAGQHFYHRFDNFNNAYNPLGSKDLRSAMLKTSNHINGEYFAELTWQVLRSLEENGTYAELRLSIYGRSRNEWDDLAKWMKANRLHSPEATKRNRWMIQVPRIFPVLKKTNAIGNFQEMIGNVFLPLFECILDPSSHPELAEVLPSICAIDSVDDESVADALLPRRSQIVGEGAASSEILSFPELWVTEENPPYSYHAYFLQANIRRFNAAAAAFGRPWHLAFRPHSGEAGAVHHLATTFLLADGINHGVNLWHSPPLQYLYYVTQIGIACSPMSNDALFLKLKDSPFPWFLARGLNVTLSTDDPLMFHSTVEPLMEEYTVARLSWGLGPADLFEVAANSARQCGFRDEEVEAALGAGARGSDAGPYAGWDPSRCGCPQRRIDYRERALAAELAVLQGGRPSTAAAAPAAGPTSYMANLPPAVAQPAAPAPASGSGEKERADLQAIMEFSFAAGTLAGSALQAKDGGGSR